MFLKINLVISLTFPQFSQPKMYQTEQFTWCLKVAGPNFMKNREPYNIKGIMIAYNLFQVTLKSEHLLRSLLTVAVSGSMW